MKNVFTYKSLLMIFHLTDAHYLLFLSNDFLTGANPGAIEFLHFLFQFEHVYIC